MRRRFTLSVASALLAAALVMPAPAAAAKGIFYRIVDGSCTASEITYVVRFVAKGGTDVNRLRVRSWVERKAPSSTTWERGFFHFPPVDYTYVDDGTRHFLHIERSYPNTPGLDERIVLHLQAYGPDGILWGGKIHTNKC